MYGIVIERVITRKGLPSVNLIIAYDEIKERHYKEYVSV